MLLLRGSEFWPVGPSHLLSICIALLLFFGLFTPYVGVLGAVAGAFCNLEIAGSSQIEGWFTITVLLAVALLGAGAYSADARLYGRRKLVL